MAKATDEHLPLPSFAVDSVQQTDGHLTTQTQSLAQRLTKHAGGLIVYFYPKDNTPGCTTQASDFSAHSDDFAKLGYQVLGVSKDSVAAHERFIQDHNLDIALISDEDERLCLHFSVIREKNLYGKKSTGLVRSTFVYNADGQLTHAQRGLRAKGHVTRLLNTLQTQ